ncbi:MAG: nitroreductase family protein [Oscillospiraceae bacterium]|jgi:nitroreductase
MIQNEVTRNITARYSCRDFDSRQIPDEVLETIIESGKYAANGRNAQAWHFTVVRTEEGKRLAVAALGKEPPAGFPPDMKWPHDADFHGAPVLVIISCDPAVPYPNVGCILAAGNMMLTATSLGLATVWSSAFTKDMFRDEESLKFKPKLMPENYEVYAAVFIGYPAKQPAPRPARKEGVVTYI